MRSVLIDNSLMGWLIDAIVRKVHAYRPNEKVEILEIPAVNIY